MFNQKGGSKTDTLIKLVLIFFVSLLSFSVGTYVGKQFSDSQHRLASLEDGDRGTASIDPEATDVKPEEAITDADIASLNEEFVDNKKVEEKTAEPHVVAKGNDAEHTEHTAAPKEKATVEPSVTHEEKHEVKKEAKREHDVVAKAAEKVAHGEDPAPKDVKHEEKRLPSSLPNTVAASTIGKFTVQVASYSSEEDAQHHANKLKEEGFSAFYVPAQINTATWYRVSVGLFTTRDQAAKFSKELMQKAHLNSTVVQKIVK